MSDSFITIQEVGELTRIRIVERGTEITKPATYWHIEDSKTRMLVNTKINTSIKKFVVGGTFESKYGCLVGLSYDKVQDLFISILGPDDLRTKAIIKDQRAMKNAQLAGIAVGTSWAVLTTILKALVLIVMIPIKIITFAFLIFHIIK